MDESILENSVSESVDVEGTEEVVMDDTEFSEDAGEYSSDSGSDSVVAGSDGETLIDSELGGVPVVIVNDLTVASNDVATVAEYYDYYTMLSTTFESYFAGVLDNIGDTEYLAFCLRDYADSSYSSYTDHYVLVYDVGVEDDALVAGSYPAIDIYRSGSEYLVSYADYALTEVPFPAYGSFGTLSDLREGVSHNETGAILFAIGFAVVYSVCHDIFDYIMQLRRR